MGMTRPVHAAWMTRPSSKSGKLGASAATRLPMPNSPMPPMNSLRVDSRPIMYAASGMTTASTSA